MDSNILIMLGGMLSCSCLFIYLTSQLKAKALQEKLTQAENEISKMTEVLKHNSDIWQAHRASLEEKIATHHKLEAAWKLAYDDEFKKRVEMTEQIYNKPKRKRKTSG